MARYELSGMAWALISPLLPPEYSQDENGYLDWSAISLDGSNIRASHCADGAQKTF